MEEAGVEEAGFEDSAGLEEAAGWEEAGLDAGAELAGAAGSQAARPKAANAPKSVRTFFFIEIVLLQLIGCFSFLFFAGRIDAFIGMFVRWYNHSKSQNWSFRAFLYYLYIIERIHGLHDNVAISKGLYAELTAFFLRAANL